eukprot:TRINITY_DN11831_c0_g3_i1.p1 TRINITY_DN11831_c0_g3~~TRINITY_DN11831_c0_g3_i1.p1  ORF type:complete len:298 (-),score=58.78 TRINITY_DN11831_c0_g3_i1:96-989(-)
MLVDAMAVFCPRRGKKHRNSASQGLSKNLHARKAVSTTRPHAGYRCLQQAFVMASVVASTSEAASSASSSSSSSSSSSRGNPKDRSAEEEALLDAVDADLAHAQRRSRMNVCMELVKRHASENELEVRLFVKNLADRLNEHDAKNYLFHSQLVNCYHNIRQLEVDAFGLEDVSAERLKGIVSTPKGKTRLRLSSNQLQVLNEILREDGVVGKEVEVLGNRMSDLTSQSQFLLAAAAVLVCGGLLAFMARQLLRPKNSAGRKSGESKAKSESETKSATRGSDRAVSEKANGADLRRRK